MILAFIFIFIVFLYVAKASKDDVNTTKIASKSTPSASTNATSRKIGYNLEEDLSVELTLDQGEALKELRSGKNILLTGKAGSGKTTLVKYYVAESRKKGLKVAVCAPTGIAAVQIGGVTLHKAFGVPIVSVLKYKSAESIEYGIKEYIKEADIIVIDEISMRRMDLFDTIMHRLQKMTHGKQIILCGDFYQLPPVIREHDRPALRLAYPHFVKGYCFEGAMWGKCDFTGIELKGIIRQKDSEFIDNLNKIRNGDPTCIDYFNKFVLAPDEPISSTALVSTNRKVEEINDAELNKIEGDEATYVMKISGKVNPASLIEEEVLRLKTGAKVMMLANRPGGNYYNDKLGVVKQLEDASVVVGWDGGETDEVFEDWHEIMEPVITNGTFENEVVGEYAQIPLKLAYAITIHKSQGVTLDARVVNLRTFADGQLYVALSRCRTPEGLKLTRSLTKEDLKVSREVKDFYDKTFS